MTTMQQATVEDIEPQFKFLVLFNEVINMNSIMINFNRVLSKIINSSKTPAESKVKIMVKEKCKSMENMLKSSVLGIITTLVFSFQIFNEAVAQNAYDYHPASACHGQIPGDIGAYEGGDLKNIVPGLLTYLICPIPRIYPRSVGKLIAVSVDLYKDPANITGSWITTVSVCAKGYWQFSNNEVCATKRSNGFGVNPGFQRMWFYKEDLAKLRSVEFGWAYYMYVIVELDYLDGLNGYVTYFDLPK